MTDLIPVLIGLVCIGAVFAVEVLVFAACMLGGWCDEELGYD